MIMDISNTIIADSTQINAADLAGPVTVTITEVSAGNAEQPVNLHVKEFPGKAFRPCKTVRRVLVRAWGKDASEYVGRSMTIYNDERVKWGGQQVGGVRVSALSHIDGPLSVPTTEARGKVAVIKVQPLRETNPKPTQARTIAPDQIEACTDEAQLREWWKASDDATKALITERAQILRHEAEAPHEL